MLRKIIMSILLLLAGFCPAFAQNWENCKADTELERGTVWFRENNRMVAFISAKPAAAIADLKCTAKDGLLEVDTRAVFEKTPSAALIIRLRDQPFNQSVKLKNCFIEAELGGLESGLNGKIYFEGSTGAEKKHFWKAQNFVLTNKIQKIRFEQTMPENLNNAGFRCDLGAAGVYLIGKVSFGEVKSTAVDPTENHITNGGAERGFYNTGLVDTRVLAMADNNIAYDGYGKEFTKSEELKIDTDVKRSGRASFKLSSDEKSEGRFFFNAVPFVPGQPAVFSLWMKSDTPKNPVGLSLFLSSGIAYVKQVHISQEWKRYDITIPSWGEKAQGLNKIGDVTGGSGAIFRMAFPEINVKSGKVWVDDASYHLAPAAEDEKLEEPVSVTGKLSKTSSYYVAGERISAELELISDKDISLPVKWELLDFNGRKISGRDAGELKLKAGEKTKVSYDLEIPAEQRGALNWNFDIGGVKNNFYLGVIDKPGKRNVKVGANYDSRQNALKAIPILKDFGFGSVRMWSGYRQLHYHGFRDVPYFKQNGFYVMMCVEMSGAAPDFLVPVDFTEWQEELKQQVSKVKGQIDCYEIMNESNIWSGRKANPDPAKYQEMTPKSNAGIIKAGAEAIHAVDPAAKIAGPTTCHTDINWTASVLLNGAGKYLDIITEHPYRELPELPEYAEDISRMKKVAEPYKKNFPIIASEAGERSVSLPRDYLITQDMRDSAAYNVRMMLIALGNGLEQYHHFAMNVGGFGSSWDLTLNGNEYTDGLPMPKPVMFAIRNAADRIGESKTAERLKLGSDYRAYIFDRGDKRVAAIWKWDGDAETVSLPAGTKAEVFDFMGSRLSTQSPIELYRYPFYIESSLTGKELGELIAANVKGASGSPVEASLEITGAKSFAVKVQNRTGRKVSGKVKILTDGIVQSGSEAEFKDIAPESAKSISFNTEKTIGPANCPFSVEITAEKQKSKYEFNLKSILVPFAAKEIKVDGDISDWPANTASIKLNSSNAVKLKEWKPELDRIEAELRLAWDENYLYVSVVSNKKDYVQNTISNTNLWRGDGLQIAFDPLHNALREQLGYQDDDYEFSAALFGDKPYVFMHRAAAATYDSVDKPVGIVNNVKCAIKTEAGRTVYELAFPRLLVSPFRLEANSSMRFDVIMNVNDGKDRVGWLELTPGIGQTPKTPGSFMDMVLSAGQ